METADIISIVESNWEKGERGGGLIYRQGKDLIEWSMVKDDYKDTKWIEWSG